MTRLKIALLISLIGLGVMWWFTRPDGRMRVVFCDVGQGDGILITQNNFQMIVDTGADNRKMLGCLEQQMPFWDKELEIIVITHWDKDHSGGLRGLMDNYKIASLYSNSRPEDESEQKIYTDNLVKNDIIKYNLMSFEVLNPDRDWGNDNDNSMVGELIYKDNKFLLTGDVTAQVEQKLVWRGALRQAQGSVLKVSHHGSAEATSEELLGAIQPKEVVISVGKNSFGHPTKLVLDRLVKNNIKIRRTDEEGNIIYVCQ